MEFVVALLILSSLFLTAVTLIAMHLFKTIQVQVEANKDLAKLQQDTTTHLANLLSTKDPMAFQQVAAMTTPAYDGYTGPILSGDEIELAEYEKKLEASMWDSSLGDSE